MIEYLVKYLKMNDVEYTENASMAEMSSVRIGGTARIVVLPNTADKLVSLLSFLEESNFDYKVVGRMSNVLPCDREYNKIILKTDNLRLMNVGNGIVEVCCGEYMPSLVSKLAAMNIGGLEAVSGIPGSVGGLIANNAGAYGMEISDVLISGCLFNKRDRRLQTFEKADFSFGLRNSRLRSEQFVLLSAKFSVREEKRAVISEKIRLYKKSRMDKQPLDFPSLGSVFKSPVGTYAAKLIDECGLKGLTVGKAQISNKHAGFIINLGGATSSDFKSLVELAREAVFARFGIMLEREIEYLK